MNSNNCRSGEGRQTAEKLLLFQKANFIKIPAKWIFGGCLLPENCQDDDQVVI